MYGVQYIDNCKLSMQLLIIVRFWIYYVCRGRCKIPKGRRCIQDGIIFLNAARWGIVNHRRLQSDNFQKCSTKRKCTFVSLSCLRPVTTLHILEKPRQYRMHFSFESKINACYSLYVTHCSSMLFHTESFMCFHKTATASSVCDLNKVNITTTFFNRVSQMT